MPLAQQTVTMLVSMRKVVRMLTRKACWQRAAMVERALRAARRCPSPGRGFPRWSSCRSARRWLLSLSRCMLPTTASSLWMYVYCCPTSSCTPESHYSLCSQLRMCTTANFIRVMSQTQIVPKYTNTQADNLCAARQQLLLSRVRGRDRERAVQDGREEGGRGLGLV